MLILLIYIVIFALSFFLVRLVVDQTASGFAARKTVTFGDESAVTSNRTASVISILTIFLLWGAFTGSSLLPRFLHAPGPFEGLAELTSQIILVIFAFVNAALLAVKFRGEPAPDHAFTVPAIIPAIGAASCLVLFLAPLFAWI